MRLIELIGENAYRATWQAGGSSPDPDGGPEITALTADSRSVRPGALFAALPGLAHDGRDFIPAAIAAGAVAVLAPEGTPADAVPAAVALIADANPRRRLALMAAAFYGAQPATIAAVTGTNGKTSVATDRKSVV